MAHAKFSPSSAHRWIPCPGSVLLEAQVPDSSSEFADEGTAAHLLGEKCLTLGTDTHDHVGEVFEVNGKQYRCDDDMAAYVQVYLDLVRGEPSDQAFIEYKSPVGYITGETKAEDGSPANGTADCVLIKGAKLTVIDLKYGRGVKVDATENHQLGLYALGIMEELSLTHEFSEVELVICQPRIDHIDRWTAPAQWLAKLQDDVKAAVKQAEQCKPGSLYLWPGNKQCKFCRAKGICPSLTDKVLTTVADDFVDLSKPIAPKIEAALDRTMDNTSLGNIMGALDLIEDWCKAIRAQTETELLAGREVPGYKLVEGRRGARAWGNADDVENLMKSMRIKTDVMYDFKLISPTTAEKLAKAGDIGPKQWPKLQALITQAQGKPSVAEASDKRPALVTTAVVDDFDDMSDDQALAILTEVGDLV